jgi:hypothetical protein
MKQGYDPSSDYTARVLGKRLAELEAGSFVGEGSA